MSNKLLFMMVISMILTGFCPVRSEIVINEIMPMPVGDEPEWVELYNAGTEVAIDDTLCIIDATNVLRTFPITLNVGQYAVLTRDTVVLKNFRAIPTENVVLIQAKIPFLNNDYDYLILSKSDGKIIDSAGYKFSETKKGISLERISPSDTVFDYCVATDSATCGFINSLTDGVEVEENKVDYCHLTIAPNPFSKTFSSSCTACMDVPEKLIAASLCKLEIFDISGNKVMETKKIIAGDGSAEIGEYVRELSCGQYILIVSILSENGEKLFTQSGIAVIRD